MSNHPRPEDCCPPFDPASWDHKEHFWQDKFFLKKTIPQFMHIPLPGTYRRAVTRLWNTAVNAGANPAYFDFLLLSHDPSPWKSDLYMSVTREIEEENNVRLSGTFISKVFDGPYNKIPLYIQEFNAYLSAIHRTSQKWYFYFPLCPACAKKYGHNYIVGFAEV